MSVRDHRLVYESGNERAYAARCDERAMALHEEGLADEEELVETGVNIKTPRTAGLGDVMREWLQANPVDAKILAYRVTHGLEFGDIALLVGKSRRAVEERWRRMAEKCADPSLLS
jgi:hypothetical protein